jgi:hypothetical protein
VVARPPLLVTKNGPTRLALLRDEHCLQRKLWALAVAAGMTTAELFYRFGEQSLGHTIDRTSSPGREAGAFFTSWNVGHDQLGIRAWK